MKEEKFQSRKDQKKAQHRLLKIDQASRHLSKRIKFVCVDYYCFVEGYSDALRVSKDDNKKVNKA